MIAVKKGHAWDVSFFRGAKMQDFAKRFYKSRAWQHCRDAYTKSKGGLCEECLKKGLYEPGEIVHHRIHITPDNINHPEITMDFNNLELLCRNCHGDRHRNRIKRYAVDELGRVTAK